MTKGDLFSHRSSSSCLSFYIFHVLTDIIFFFSDIQEFYELTLLDDTKSIQQKTAETIRIANKWEANDGPITPAYKNDVSIPILSQGLFPCILYTVYNSNYLIDSLSLSL